MRYTEDMIMVCIIIDSTDDLFSKHFSQIRGGQIYILFLERKVNDARGDDGRPSTPTRPYTKVVDLASSPTCPILQGLTYVVIF